MFADIQFLLTFAAENQSTMYEGEKKQEVEPIYIIER